MANEVVTRIPPELDGERVDKALAGLFDLSRSAARGLVEMGVTLDGDTVKPSDRVSDGAVMRSPEPPAAEQLEPEEVEFSILHEDQHLVVVDKPAGLVVHPGAGRSSGTLVSGLLHRYPRIEGVGDTGRWGLVHRLDKDTSGVMVVALDDETHAELRGMIKRREVERSYTALVDGTPSAPTGTIDSPIGRDKTMPMRMAITADGKRAVTHYRVVRTFPDHDCSLLEVELETGRTHQIRVHLAAIDHPVIGDPTYGMRTTRATSPRQFLHARRLEFTHPATGDSLKVDSPLPDDLEAVLSSVTVD